MANIFLSYNSPEGSFQWQFFAYADPYWDLLDTGAKPVKQRQKSFFASISVDISNHPA